MLFRSLRWTIMPLVLVHVSLVWTKALLVLANMRLSMVSSILTSLITIVGIATVTHITIRFRELRGDHDRVAAFRQTFIDLAPAVFWTCVTTAIGFAALLSSGVTPVRSFGLMVATGVLLLLVASGLLLPALVLAGWWEDDPHRAPAERGMLRLLDRTVDWVEHAAGRLMLGFVVISLLAFAGLFRLQVETDFSKNFREESPILQSIRFFEDRLGGVGTWEVNFPAPKESGETTVLGDGEKKPSSDPPTASTVGSGISKKNDSATSVESALTQSFVDRATTATAKIRDVESPDGVGITKAMSLGDGTGFIPRLTAPTLDRRRRMLAMIQPEYEPGLYNPDVGRMRIMLRAREQHQAESKLQLIENVETVARQTFPEAQATGLFVLLAHLIESLLSDQLVSFIIAAIGVAVVVAIAFRSLPIGVMAVLPNVLPILLVIGGMGWLGSPINIGTAMIASVSMGLTVDSSIHYLVGYRRARADGLDHYAALRATHANVGRAVIFASIALILGFSVLTLSHFIPLVYFGLLVSVAMLGGLLGGLVLLPLLLRWGRLS